MLLLQSSKKVYEERIIINGNHYPKAKGKNLKWNSFKRREKTNFNSRILEFSRLFCIAGIAQWGERSLGTSVAWV